MLYSRGVAAGEPMLLFLLGCVDSWCERFNLDCEIESAEVVPGVDADGDLWSADEDCDDLNAAINLLAVEVCNGVDDDCDGAADEAGAEGQSSYYPDEDGDGFGVGAAPTLACEQPEAASDHSGDCDDGDGEAYPGAEEVPYDGIDQDCDGADLADLDGDGWDPPEDCDDDEYYLNPGREEV